MAFFKFTVPDDTPSLRLDKFLTSVLPNYSRSFLVKCQLKVNDASARPSKHVVSGDHVEVVVPALRELAIVPENIPLKIIYEDDSLLVIDKPAGMVVHPTDHGGHVTGTLINALLHHLNLPTIQVSLKRSGESSSENALRPGLVHRLDRDTSGLIVVAKTASAKKFLSLEFEKRRVEKIYLALVAGEMRTPTGRIDAPIARHPTDRTLRRVAVAPDSRESVTEFSVLERFPTATLVSVKLLTGRTHQIRVHFASIGHPVIGDEMYGRPDSFSKSLIRGSPRQFLHAQFLSFTHPETCKRVEFESPLPEDLEKVLTKFRARGESKK